MDFEGEASYDVTVVVADDHMMPLNASTTVTIKVQDTNEKPVMQTEVLLINESTWENRVNPILQIGGVSFVEGMPCVLQIHVEHDEPKHFKEGDWVEISKSNMELISGYHKILAFPSPSLVSV